MPGCWTLTLDVLKLLILAPSTFATTGWTLTLDVLKCYYWFAH